MINRERRGERAGSDPKFSKRIAPTTISYFSEKAELEWINRENVETIPYYYTCSFS